MSKPRMIVSSLDATLKHIIPALVESRYASCTVVRKRSGIFDVSSKLHRDLGFEWRPIQKSSLLNTLCKNMKKCRTFVKNAIKSDLVSSDDLVTLFYDHVPLTNENAPTFTPHWTALISPNQEEAFIQLPDSLSETTKESLSSLLDICAALECQTAYIAIKKSCEEIQPFLQAFVGIGFQLVSPKVKSMDGYLLLGYEL